MGGVNYIVNLVSSLAALPEAARPEIALIPLNAAAFANLPLHEAVFPHVARIICPGFAPEGRPAGGIPPVIQVGSVPELFTHIDFLYGDSGCIGLLAGTGLPGSVWIPDFQRNHMPEFFQPQENQAVERVFNHLAAKGGNLVLSSEHAAGDWRRFYGERHGSRVRTRVMHFYSRAEDSWFTLDPAEVQRKYDLPERFLICCNQFWKHKNHETLFAALKALRGSGTEAVLVCTGSTGDYRNPQYFASLERFVAENGLARDIRILGQIPRGEQIALVRRSLAVVQPSRFEGWSTVVEDARLLGKRMLLSDFAVHIEQAPPEAAYFPVNDSGALAQAMRSVLAEATPGPHPAREKIAAESSQLLLQSFAENFMSLAHETVGLCLARRAAPQGNASPAVPAPAASKSGILVSAIVSTYKSERYIRAAIEDLFAQTLYAKGQLEIVIINSNSPENEDEIIRELIAGRPNVIYRKTPERETLYKAWNRAIELSSGRYITNANTDDRHLPYALERMAQALEARPDCILAYADIAVTDDPQVTVGTSPVPCQYRWPEYNRQLYFINSFAGPQPMWRRSAHERYGFFDPEMKSAGDYDLFLRFAAGEEKFLHIPEVLGLMLRSNDSVGLSNAELTARETALARNRSWRAEWGQMPPAQGIPVVVPVPAGVDPYTYQRPAPQPQGASAPQAPENSVPGRLQQLVQRHRQEPGNQQVLTDLRGLRESVAQFLLDVPEGQLAAALQGELGQCLKLITDSALRDEPLLAHEQANADELRSRLADPKFSQELREKFTFCYMLYRYAHQHELPLEGLPLKGRALGNFLEYMLYNPEIFLQIGEAERFARHIGDTTAGLRRWLEREPDDPHCRQAVNFFLNRENFINMYFNSLDTRQMYEDRAALMSAGLRQAGLPLGWQPPRRDKKRGKLRVGFFNSHFGPQTETYTSIPHFEHLDRERFELYLYTFSTGDSALTRYCQGLTANFRVLPVKDLPAAAAAIRGDDLDVLVIGTNVTAVTNPAALLACFRLARAQMVNNSCPVTSGFPEVDGYISGDLVETGDYQRLYKEKVYLVRGTAHCFAYETDKTPPQRSFTRAEFGIPADAVVFSSGANFYKIIPELKSTWAKILAQVPGSFLLLHPFNPNWSNAYPRERFLESFRAELARHGVDASRLIISMNALPTRSDIVELWKASDIYLDSFPFAGVNSTVDPLDAGVPVVIWEGEMFRSRMAGSLLRELKLEEYIAHSEEEYIALAARLANDAQLRGEVAGRIRRAMADNPCFYDRRNFSAEVGKVLAQAAADFSR